MFLNSSHRRAPQKCFSGIQMTQTSTALRVSEPEGCCLQRRSREPRGLRAPKVNCEEFSSPPSHQVALFGLVCFPFYKIELQSSCTPTNTSHWKAWHGLTSAPDSSCHYPGLMAAALWKRHLGAFRNSPSSLKSFPLQIQCWLLASENVEKNKLQCLVMFGLISRHDLSS